MFDNIEDKQDWASAKQMLADLLDAMQDIEDDIEVAHLKNGHPFHLNAHMEKYGKACRDAIGAQHFQREDVSIQLKCISRGEVTLMHKDVQNCHWLGYSKTSALCFFLVDACGDVWSLKLIANSQTKIGNYFDKKLKMDEIMRLIHWQVEALDQAYKLHIFEHTGGYKYPEKLTTKTFKLLVLDDNCPWESVNIGNSIMQKQLEFPVTPMCDYFLSTAADMVYHLHKRSNDQKAVCLTILGGYQTGFHWYFFLGMKY